MWQIFLLFLCSRVNSFVVVGPFVRSRGEILSAKKKNNDERMASFYEQKFSASAAEEYKFARERDKKKYNAKRAGLFGSRDGEEYDLDLALAANTDDSITKIIAGAFIFSVILALYFGVLSPILSPPTFQNEDGVTFIQDPRTGVFYEK